MTGVPTVALGGWLNVIVGVGGARTWNDCVTSGALPSTPRAVIVHVPVVTAVTVEFITVEFVTVHTGGVSDLNSTVSGGDADANRGTVEPTVMPPAGRL